MKKIPSAMRPAERPKLSLEQKIMRLIHRYRAAEERHRQKDAARSKRLRSTRWSPPTFANRSVLAQKDREIIRVSLIE
jgi:hypothetical protein